LGYQEEHLSARIWLKERRVTARKKKKKSSDGRKRKMYARAGGTVSFLSPPMAIPKGKRLELEAEPQHKERSQKKKVLNLEFRGPSL